MSNERDQFSPVPSDELRIPATLQAALRGAVVAAPPIPAVRDAAIMRLARERFAEGRRRRLVRYSLFAATAAAAASVLLMFSLNYLTPPVTPHATPIAINTSHPTILDAFALARELRDHPQAVQQTPAYHVTHGPTVDQRDIDALARAAVALTAVSAKSEATQ